MSENQLRVSEVRAALLAAADRAAEWPAGHGVHWGKTAGGEWTEFPEFVGPFG